MLIFWLCMLFGGWWFEDSVYEYLRDSFCNYIDSFDSYYFQDWQNSQSKTFVKQFLNSSNYETYFTPIKTDEDAIKAFTDFGLDMSKYNLQNDEDTARLFIDFLKKAVDNKII